MTSEGDLVCGMKRRGMGVGWGGGMWNDLELFSPHTQAS